MSAIDFITPVKKEAVRLGLVHAPEFRRSDYWHVRLAYRTDTTLLFFDCEPTRDYGVDVLFGPASKKDPKHSFHTFLRLFDSPAATKLGHCLPKDQRGMDDLLRLCSDALMKHRKPIFDQTEQTIAAMERAFVERDLANQPFRPVGRFAR
jgi:hypothetical protein